MTPHDDDLSPAYAIRNSEVAEAEIEAVYELLAARDFNYAERWLAQMQNALHSRALEHARLPSTPYVPFDAHLFPSRDMRFVRVGAWRVLYEFADEDGDGLMDTLVVSYVRPAAQNTSTSDENE